MPKQLIINDCRDCPYCIDWVFMPNSPVRSQCRYDRCDKEITENKLVNGFPKWCPLPDAKGDV